MIKITLNDEQMQKRLNELNLTYGDLADQVRISFRPTERVVTEWLRGKIAQRWRPAIAELLGVEAEQLSTKTRAKAAIQRTMNQRGITREQLLEIEVAEEGLTRATVGAWQAGGGLTIDRLIAVCKKLGVQPHEIISEDAKRLFLALATGEGKVEDLEELAF